MKCPNCGCQDFYDLTLFTDKNYFDGGGGEVYLSGQFKLHAYLCKKCGKVELYSPDGLFGIKAQEKKHAEEEAARFAAEKRKEFLLKEKERLEAFIKDENQTVKAVNQAKEDLDKVRSELRDLGVHLL